MYWHKRPSHKETNPHKRLGLIHVYTGEGKGKTTAALGVALRAAGHDMKVLIIQFVKGHKDYGEILAASKIPDNIEIVQFGTPDMTDMHEPTAMDTYLAEQGMAYARRAMVYDRPDILVLDEINTAAKHNLIPIQEVLDFLDHKHQDTEVILTGRFAPKEFLNAADLVTVMTSSKDPYDKDFVPRRGVEH